MPNQHQTSFYPVQIVQTYLNDTGSADMQIRGVGSDNLNYAIKSLADGNGRVPATEMFCYELASCLDIATPGYSIVQLNDNSIAFGSVWEGRAFQVKDTLQAFDILEGRTHIEGLGDFFSKVYAFDLFINNVDRHFGNYLFRRTAKTTIALAFDFSRAWYVIDHAGYEATAPTTNTRRYNRYIRNYNHYAHAVAEETLRNISKLPKNRIETIINAIPSEWFHGDFAKEFLNWWGSDDMNARISHLQSEI